MNGSRRRHIALLIETSNAYARGLLSGVLTYVQQVGNWSIFLPEQERGGAPPPWLSRWQGDGIIARIETDAIARAVRKTKLPVVDLSAARYVAEVPWVETNDRAIAAMAAEHLLERGFRQIGFCGDPGFNWSNWRLQGLQQAMADRGITVHEYQSIPRYDPNYSWNKESARMAKWLRELPKPIGIMACYDIKAQQLLETCRELDLAVPEQVAVIGVDNDPLICDLSSPPLTSVIPNANRAGFEAAAILDRLLQGEQVALGPRLIDPIGIQVRQSTEVLAIDDPDVAQAVRYIRENCDHNIRVADILQHVKLSRRQLEHRFAQILGRTPHDEILRRKMERVKQLLLQTKLSVAEIADRTGFPHSEYLCVAFLRETGCTLSDFREQARMGKGTHSNDLS